MIVTILARLDGKNTSGSPWYQAGQRWAMEYEISDGTNMTGAITREQLVTMLFRYAVKNGLEAVTLSENLAPSLRTLPTSVRGPSPRCSGPSVKA